MKKLTKYIAAAILLAVSALAFAGGGDPTATFTLTPSLTQVMPGETVTVTYKAKFTNAGGKIAGLQNVVKYDTNVFELVSASKGTDLPSATDPKTDTAGEVGFGLMTLSGGDSVSDNKDYIIGSMTLKVKSGAAVGTATLTQTEPMFMLPDFEERIPSAEALSLSIISIPKGSLTLNLTPTTAKYIIDGKEYDAGAKYEVEFPSRETTSVKKTVSFKAVEGYFEPADKEYTIEAGKDKKYSVNYVEKGKVTVTLTPATAQWSIDGGATWKNSGDTITGLSEGSYTIKYSAVEGYKTPADGAFTVVAQSGEGKNIHNIKTNYAELGALNVTLTPSTAKWKLDNDSTERVSGDSVKVNAGTHTIKFMPVEGYTTPSDETVQVSDEGLAVSYSYKQKATLTYTLTPATAKWKVNGKEYSSGESVMLDAGKYDVTFSDAAGYFTPDKTSVSLAVAEKTTKSLVYTEKGKVKVTIKNAGSKTPTWTLNGKQHTSGYQVTGLEEGSYTIKFEEIAGFHTPKDITFTVKKTNTTAQNTFEYSDINYGDEFGYVKVTFEPESAASATWSVDGKTWYPGDTAQEIKAGTYTMQFAEIEGFRKTDSSTSQQVTVGKGKTTNITAKYIEKGSFDDENYAPQSKPPVAELPATKPDSVTDVSADVLSSEDSSKMLDDLMEGGTDKVAGLPEKVTKLTLLTGYKFNVTHTSSGAEALECIATLADGITAPEGKILIAILQSNKDTTAFTAFVAKYDSASRKVSFTAENFANFFSEAPVMLAVVDQETETSSDGCNAGFGALAMLFAAPLFFRKKD